MIEFIKGWLIFRCYPYNDHVPFVPFTVEYWTIDVLVKLPWMIKAQRVWRYKRAGHMLHKIRRGIYAPQPMSRCFDSSLWTGRA